MTYDIQEEN